MVCKKNAIILRKLDWIAKVDNNFLLFLSKAFKSMFMFYYEMKMKKMNMRDF